ncbi:DUF3515 domain-containing protein [Microbacterium sp. zg.Y1090]|uniref:DUF3515 domain-containing protein n=1 Tax=Microbacterium TaxID=33882 RepID=UPI00214B7334|nr:MULTISPECIES: DUF3515 domain-containing protein [unclassified Microbacterium]MCR2811614.1 DUF3515 domain-containing protein [Microbacterium sp. zg.Y1084]MCR2818964.1 DUF3515 domain-containing protein [Microbacterium sp. zg.Y1090]MDL5487614.1 DUF3515 domain-containing protein [Microbacterium sp. zg-Y1211]WIM27269.1 DUF3515 domain-containing protein [Microbacterium sp. zg-Y1090]
MSRLRPSAALTAVLGLLLLTGCGTSSVSLTAAPDANDPLCAEVTVRLPSTVDGADRRWTDAQATAAWGDPTAVILTCGVTPPGPTEARCITIGGVDWIVDESQAPRYRITTYGRTPAVEVFVDNEQVSPNEVLSRFAPYIVDTLPRERQCTETAELLS